jgi:hypothetical protein
LVTVDGGSAYVTVPPLMALPVGPVWADVFVVPPPLVQAARKKTKAARNATGASRRRVTRCRNIATPLSDEGILR